MHLLTYCFLNGGPQFRVDSFGKFCFSFPHVAKDGLEIDNDAICKLRQKVYYF